MVVDTSEGQFRMQQLLSVGLQTEIGLAFNSQCEYFKRQQEPLLLLFTRGVIRERCVGGSVFFKGWWLAVLQQLFSPIMSK